MTNPYETSFAEELAEGPTAGGQPRDNVASAPQTFTNQYDDERSSPSRPGTSPELVQDLELARDSVIEDLHDLKVEAFVYGDRVDIAFVEDIELHQVAVHLTGPEGFKEQSGALSFNTNEPLVDGHYKYKVVADLAEPRLGRSLYAANQGRAVGNRATPGQARGVVATGSMYILDGASVNADIIENYYSAESW